MQEDTKEESTTRHLSVNLTSQQFDWKAGQFINDNASFPLWLQLLLHIVICVSIITITLLVYYKELIAIPYSLIVSEPPEAYSINVEVIRWILFLSVGYLSFVLTNSCAVVMTYSVHAYYTMRKKGIPQKIRKVVDHALFLRVYMAWFVTSIILTLTGYILFPLSGEEATAQLLGTAGSSKDAKKVGDGKGGEGGNAGGVITGLAFAELLKEYSTGHSLQFFVNRSCFALLVMTGLILLEKIIIQKIAATFYHRSFGERITNNTFGIKTSRKLKELILQRHPELAKADLATILFSGTCPPHRNVINIADVVSYLPSSDAEKYFQMLDIEAIGEMNTHQVRRAVHRLLDERENLNSAMLNQANVIKKLDNVFIGFAYFAIAIICFGLFQVSFENILTALAGIGGILLLVSSGTIKTAFESIVFVIFTHPFDVGDKVLIKTDEYVVKELGLWTSTFEGAGNQVTYVANSKLRSETIVNHRRSPFQTEVISIKVLPTTTDEKLKALEASLNSFLQQNARDYIPKTTVGGFNIVDKNAMKIDIPLTHRGNFQDSALKAARSTNFMLYLKEAIVECGIDLSPAPLW